MRSLAIEPGPQKYLFGFGLLGPAQKCRLSAGHDNLLPDMVKPFDCRWIITARRAAV
jgi:hypothetical protein